jgi:hypothetical protein
MEKHDVTNRNGDLMEFNMIYIDLPEGKRSKCGKPMLKT